MQEIRKVGVSVVLFLLFSAYEGANKTYYSSYFQKSLTSSEIAAYTSNGTLDNCTNLIAACNASEGRRIDGSCNNLNHPTKGTTRTPQETYLPKVFNKTSSTVFDPILSKSGLPLQLTRVIRDKLISDGQAKDERFTELLLHFLVLIATDFTNTRDTSNYVSVRPFCCSDAGKSDIMCAPNLIPDNDYVHRYSGIRCLNMTRPLTFQTSGCLPNTTAPTRIVDATPLLDMSPVYGNVVESVRRTYVNGTLATETINGTAFPKSFTGLLLGINYVPLVIMWQYHNFVAGKLQENNPCWSDNKTFHITREIVIAVACQMYYYELFPQMMGTTNMTNDGIIDNTASFRETYNSSLYPRVAPETLMAFRLMHKMQSGDMKFYSSNGTFLNITFPLVNLTTNLTYIKENGNFERVLQSSTIDAAGKLDDMIADPDILNRGLGGLQKSMDIMANDLSKNRYIGFQCYVNYLYFCFGINVTSFDDLIGIVHPEALETLKELYTSVYDIELLVGMWVELIMDGGYVPPTFYCLISKQLLHNMQSDRFWYELEDRPCAFTEDQLAEIRSITVARIICDVSNSLSQIQPSAFLQPGPCNEVVSCDDIPQMDFSVWTDATCTSDYNSTSSDSSCFYGD